MLQRLQQEVRTLLVDEEQTDQSNEARVRRFLRFWVTVGQSFVKNRCPVRASALAYSSLLAFVPLLAVVIGISTSVLKNDAVKIRGWIEDIVFRVAPQLQNSPEFGVKLDTIVTEINRMIDNVHSGALGTTGVIALLVMILFMLARVEETLNDIWGITRGRSWYMRLVNYWAAISLGPIIIFAAIGFSTTLRLEQTQAWLVGSSKVTASDLKGLPALAAKLRQAPDPLSRFLHDQLDEETLLVLTENQSPATHSVPLQTALVRDLNRIIQGPSIYDPERFHGVTLGPETKELLTKTPRGAKVVRLNRMLLEDAYALEIASHRRGRMPVVGPFLISLLQIPILSAACALFYALMPNTKVRWRAAFAGGAVAGVLWYLNNSLSVLFVSQVTQNSAIYGSLGIIPVFMIGLYFFWSLLLFGAQVAYTFQNRRSYLAARQMDRVHQDGREFVALQIMIEAARAFASGATAPSASSLAQRLAVPGQLISHITSILLRTHLLVEVSEGESAYLPARPLDCIRVADVLNAMRRGVGDRLPTQPDAVGEAVETALGEVAAAEQKAGSRTLGELVGAQQGSPRIGCTLSP